MCTQDSFFLNCREVHIWSACLSKSENKLLYFSSLLSKDEKEKVSHFRFSKDQKRYTISRGILRHLLGSYLREEPEKIEFLYGLWGKPCLPQEKNIFFNLSHSEDYALYAFVRKYEVGIDIEFVNHNLVLEEIAQGVFTAEEFSYWNSFSDEEKRSSFFKYWVSKEAFLKAMGKGWLETKQILTFFEVNARVTNKLELRQNGSLLKEGEVTYPYLFEHIPGYASALFVNGAPLHLSHFVWDQPFAKK